VLTSQRESESSESNKRVANAELEAKRHLLSKNELERVLDRTEREASASKRKCEVLQREVFNVTAAASKEKVQFEAENNDLHRRLAAYEKIESDLDALVLQAADCDDADVDNPLWAFNNVPTQSRRRIEQSARLAKRVINLEKINIDLNREVAQLKSHNLKIKESLSNADKALDSVDQPYAYLVQNQRSKDGEIVRLNDTIKNQNKRIIQLEETVDRLRQVKEQLMMDLEKLLANQAMIKNMKLGLMESVGSAVKKEYFENIDSNQPDPLLFTN